MNYAVASSDTIVSGIRVIDCGYAAVAAAGAPACAGVSTAVRELGRGAVAEGVGMSQRDLTPPGAAFGQAALAAGSVAFELAKKWWVLLIRGILLIVLGILAFLSPITVVIFIGVTMLLDGISMLFAGFSDQPAGQSRWPLILIGILGLVAGLIVLWNPALGGITLVYVVAAWAVIIGILEIIQAIRLREEIDNEWWLIITGVLAVIFGVLVFTNGLQGVIAGGIAIAWVFAIFAILAGILSILLAFRVRDFGTKIGAVT